MISDEFKITLYKWLINSEWHIHNELISIRNDFDRRSFHNLQDCYNLLRAEQRYNDFKAFSCDLEKLLIAYVIIQNKCNIIMIYCQNT